MSVIKILHLGVTIKSGFMLYSLCTKNLQMGALTVQKCKKSHSNDQR